jgi:leucyl aminopeptidase
MEITAVATIPIEWMGDLLAIGFFEDEVKIEGDTSIAALDSKLQGAIADIVAETDFKGKAGSTSIVRIGKDTAIKKVCLVGLGKSAAFDLHSLRVAGATILRLAAKQRIKSIGIDLPVGEDNVAGSTQAIVEGLLLAAHRDRRFKSDADDNPNRIEKIELLGRSGNEAAIAKGSAMAAGTILARELVAAPANYVTPIEMSETAAEIANDYDGMTLKVLGQSECEALEMGAFLGVARASAIPPQFIHLTYTPKGTPRRKLAIVGKGLTFDSGGLNIKGAGSGIETMKMDMGGAAAMLGAAKTIGILQPDVEVHFISAVTENMIGGKAMHPGDILLASNGKTIEVNNTDAEGRLTLADALVYAEKLGVDAIVDLATLTGACIIALGDDIAGLWSQNQALADGILAAAKSAGEKFWQMPFEERYFEGIKSPIADMKNTGPRAGGSITAAIFLKQFVRETPWAHLDVAGPVWSDKENGINNSGATGYPVRTLVNWAIS